MQRSRNPLVSAPAQDINIVIDDLIRRLVLSGNNTEQVDQSPNAVQVSVKSMNGFNVCVWF